MHIALLRGELTLPDILARATIGPVRLSPVVASELLRGARPHARPHVDELVARLTPIEPPSWRLAFVETGRLLPKVFDEHEAIGLAQLQNDVLIALTARHCGAVLVTRDQHFLRLQAELQFALRVV
ncbi:MAG: PIN domain-containing protein [Planctomycetes bacterium]|nr:PIN domain-containing protein [Planctomycetota bacterium]